MGKTTEIFENDVSIGRRPCQGSDRDETQEESIGVVSFETGIFEYATGETYRQIKDNVPSP